MDRRTHWDGVYASRAPTDVSWFQAVPETSMALIEVTGLGRDARVLDVGGGASTLVDHLLLAGYEGVGVLDLSPIALGAARDRLGDLGARVEWIEGDILDYQPAHAWDLWHDRAVFHFLVDAPDRVAYREALYRSVPADGHVIVATFGPEGPSQCSGLDTLRCAPEQIEEELGSGVQLVEARDEEHITPSGTTQRFTYARLVRVR